MPIVRYQLRNEYGLADPELYGSADKEDPEALLDGVAMAGLVGVLRQLGDLAEFAAEIFHNLHEEVMITAARGHALMLRVQQLEVDVPAIERNFLSQTTQSPLSHDTGIDWHPNLQIDENLITQVDMPRFVLNSYEESRGPPRLFMLDKFDIAGDGACLKRYSDPSFFKINFTASEKMEPDIQWEKRSRKNKKKVLHRRNGETPESHRLVHMNSESKNSVSEKTPDNQPVKRVKLKIRQLNDSSSIINSYMEHVVGKQPPEYADFSGNSTSQSQLKLTRKESSELAPAIREVIMDNSIDRPFLRERNGIKPSNKEERSVTWKEEILLDVTDSQREEKELFQKTNDDAERSLPTFTKNQKDLFFDTNNKREDDADANSRTNDSLDGYVSDAAASELDTYLDALTTMDSGIETDNEIGPKPISNLFVKDFRKMDYNKSEGKELMSESLGSHIFTESSAKHSLSNDKESRTPNEDSSNSLTNSVSHDGLGVLTVTLMDLKTHENETHDTESDSLTNRELTGDECYVNSIEEHMKVDVPIPLSTLQVKSFTCCLADATSTHNLSASLEEFDSATLSQNTLSNDIDALETSGIHLEDEYGPTVNSHISEAPEDTHSPSLLNEIDSCADIDKALGGTFHKRSGEWETTFSNDCLTSDEKPDNFTNDLMQLGEERSKNLPVQTDPSLAAPKIVTCTEELEGILSKPNVSDHFQVTRETVDEVISTTSDEESSLPLSLNNGELHAPVCQGSDVDTGENASPGVSVIPIDNTSLSMLLPNGLPGAVESVVSSNENVDSTRTHVGPKDAACLSENKVVCKENAGSFSENENIVYDNSLTSLSFKTEVLQESCKLDEVYVTHELLPSHEQLLSSVSHVSNSSTALSFKTEVLQESCKLDEVDVTHEQLPNHEQLLSSVSNDEGKNSFLVRERRDLFLPTEDQLDFCSNVAPFISPMELPQSESCSPHSIIECAKLDELPSGDVNFKECSCLNIDHEEHISYVSASEKKEFVTGESCPKDSVASDVELIPEIAVFEEEHVLAGGHLDSVHTENIVDASSEPECGDHGHVCHTEQFELVEEKLETAVSTSATSSVEMEDGKLKKTILQNEPDLFVSRMDDFLENIEECNSENQTGAHEHQYPSITSLLEEESDAIIDPVNPKCGSHVLDSFDHMGLKPASLPAESEQMLDSPQRKSCDKMLLGSFEECNLENQTGAHEHQHPTSLLREESDAVVDPGNPKSGRHVLDSFDHLGLKPVSVPAESKQVLVISPQSKRCDKMLLGTFDVSNVEPVKQSGIDVHMLEFNGNTECRSVNQPTPHSEVLASSHHRLTINDDLFISDHATSESICPSEVSLPCDESDEISLLQKLGNLSLSGTQFQREQPPEQDNNFSETHGQSIVVEAEEYSVDALSSDRIYQPDVNSAGATCLNPPEKAADSPLQSSYGIPVTSITDVAQTLPSLGAFNGGMIKLRPPEVPLDEDPPLPPLPPLQWRMGKLRPSSMMKGWEMFRPQHEADKMTTMLPMDHQYGQTVMQQTNPHLLAQLLPNGDDQLGYLASEDQSMDASKPSTLPLSTEDKKLQDDSFASGVQMKAHSVNSLPLVPFEEYYHQNQKHLVVGKMPQIGFTSRQTTLELTDMRSQHFPTQSEGESMEPLKSSASQSTSVHETEFSHGPENLETAAVHASNPFLSLAPTEGESCSYGVLEGKSVQNLETAAMHPTNPFSSSSCTECSGHGVHGDRNSLFMDVDESPPQEFLIPEEGNIQLFSFPAAEHARSNGRPRSLLNRPRDPLIEEVASHDKSTLRRVSELVRPSAQLEGERNTLLDQIRSKTFNLKPAVVAKPNMEAPPTNLKVAAILERANAIRQAFVGSDEEDEEDGWSDS